MIKNIITNVLRMGGDDALRALEKGIKAGSNQLDDDCAMLLANVKNKLKSSRTTISPRNMKSVAASNTTRVKPSKPESAVEKKISSIRQRLKAPQEAYQAENAAFRKAQQAHIDKFNKYVDDYTNKYSQLVAKLDEVTDPKEIAQIEKQLQKLEAQAEKALKSRLEKLGTLSPSEIQAKIKEVKNLTQIRVQNLTYANSGSNVARAEAEKFIKEVAQEFKAGNRELTVEQLDFLLAKRIQKLEKLVFKATLEDKVTIKRTANVAGMPVPIEFPVMGTSATDEISKLYNGKSPKEAMEYYKTLQIKMREAVTKLKNAESMEQNGYIRIKEPKIDIPIKDAQKSKELKWLEQQLTEKQNMLKAESQHVSRGASTLTTIG